LIFIWVLSLIILTMELASLSLDEVSQHVLDSVKKAIKNVQNEGLNFINMEIRNMGVVTISAHKFTDPDFEQIMRIFMSEQPHSTGNITVNFSWILTEASHRKLFQLMEEATIRAEKEGANMHHSVEVISDDKIVVRSFPVDK